MQRWSTDGAVLTKNSATNRNNTNNSGQFVLHQSDPCAESYSFHGAGAIVGAGAVVRPSTAVPLPTMFSVRIKFCLINHIYCVIYTRVSSQITFASLGGWVVKNFEKLQTF